MTREEKQKKLDQISLEIEYCEICKIGKIGIAVPGEGDPDADVVFIGEAPGKQEAKTGRPFIGRSGHLLRRLIKEAGLNENEIYITSPVKYLPERGTPTPADIAHGRTHLNKQLDVIQPTFIVLLGSTAVQAVLEEKLPIMKVHGSVIKKDGRTYFITLHPAAGLRNPSVSNYIVEDFKKLKELLQEVHK
jgi:DNA polymerase